MTKAAGASQKQVVLQYRAVAHLANAIARVHTEIAATIKSSPELLDLRGKRSAHLMEILGDILNGMDAVDPAEDAWMDPIFKEAHRLWPKEQQ